MTYWNDPYFGEYGKYWKTANISAICFFSTASVLFIYAATLWLVSEPALARAALVALGTLFLWIAISHAIHLSLGKFIVSEIQIDENTIHLKTFSGDDYSTSKEKITPICNPKIISPFIYKSDFLKKTAFQIETLEGVTFMIQKSLINHEQLMTDLSAD